MIKITGISETIRNLPVEVRWSTPDFSDEVYVFDLNEQVYKKRKVYFHISNQPLSRVLAKPRSFRIVPAAFFAMDALTCTDFFNYKFRKKTDRAFLHRCVNKRPMNLFNPGSEQDLNTLNLTPKDRTELLTAFLSYKPKGKNNRYWRVLEEESRIVAIYNHSKYDGIALDFFEQRVTDWNERTEGFCLFDRSIDAITVVDVAVVEDIRSPLFNFDRLTFEAPSYFQRML